MRAMGLQAIYRRPRTSQPGLQGASVSARRHGSSWAADITYDPMARGFLYLVAIGKPLRGGFEAEHGRWNWLFCVEALEEALGKGKPEVFNTDQGSQFTSEGFTGILARHGVKISMDGKGRYADNIFMERLWKR